MGKVRDISWEKPDAINHDNKREGMRTKNMTNGNQSEEVERERDKDVSFLGFQCVTSHTSCRIQLRYRR